MDDKKNFFIGRKRKDRTEDEFNQDDGKDPGVELESLFEPMKDDQGTGGTQAADKCPKVVSQGNIEQIIYGPQKIEVVTTRKQKGLVVIGKVKWKIELYSFDRDMFSHRVEGRLNPVQDPRYRDRPEHIPTKVWTTTTPFTRYNLHLIVPKLLASVFSDEAEDDRQWSDEDLKLARQRFDEFQHSGAFELDLEQFLNKWAAPDKDEQWAKLALKNELVWTCILFKEGRFNRLLDLYHLSTFQSGWSSSELMRLLKQVETNAYPLFFRDLYQGGDLKFPASLPELRIQRLETLGLSYIVNMGPQRILDIWLYTALVLNQHETAHMYTELERRERPRTPAPGSRFETPVFIRLESSHKDTIIEHRQRYEHYLKAAQHGTPEKEHQWLPTTSLGDFGPSLTRLLDQGSLVMLGQQVHVKTTWLATLGAVRLLRQFWHKHPPGSSSFLAAAERKERKEDQDVHRRMEDLSAYEAQQLLASVSQNSKKEQKQKRELCGEQRDAVRMIHHNAISCLTGPGGSGKTEVIQSIGGRMEEPFHGCSKEVIENNPELFYKIMLRNASSGTGQDGKESREERYILKGEVMVFTPTGIAAVNAEERGTPAKTISWALTCKLHNVNQQRFTELKVAIVDEMGMVPEINDDREMPHRFYELVKFLTSLPKLEHIVHVGDYRQLAPYGAGQPFVDMLDTWMPKMELTENHRTSAEAKVLSLNAKLIAERNTDLDWSHPCCQVLQCREYTLDKIFEEFKDRWQDVQIVCHMNRTRIEVNQIMMAFSQFPTHLQQYKAPGSFFRGQKIVFRKNLEQPMLNISVKTGQIDIIDEIYDSSQYSRQASQGIDQMNDKRSVLCTRDKFANPDDKNVKRYLRFRSGRVCQMTAKLLQIMQPGYAVTLHSLQSAGVDHVILWHPTDKHSMDLWNQFVYTWITRAKKSAKFVTSCAVGMAAFSMYVMKEEEPRKTVLKVHMGKDVNQWPTFQTVCKQCKKFVSYTFEKMDMPPMSTPESGLTCDDCALKDMDGQ